jgi:protein-tyrosine phosphatase
MSGLLPEPLSPAAYHVMVVCTGNICRSPTADVILNAMLAERQTDGRNGSPAITASSCGLGGWHVGDRMDDRSAAQLRRLGYDPDPHRARQLPHDWSDRYDLVLAMDSGHLRELRNLSRSLGVDKPPARNGRVMLFGDFDPVTPGADVPDPYYGEEDGFQRVASMIERTCAAVIQALFNSTQSRS